MSGSNLRASGVDWDLRRDGKPYLVYPELDFKVWTHPDGDSFARYWVRLQETRESARMVLQMLDQLPAGPIMAKVPRIIKVPEGEVWVETENPLGQMGYYVVSKGATGPFRVKIRSASFSNVSILPWLLRGVYVPDVITILGVALLHPRGHRPVIEQHRRRSRVDDRRGGPTLAIKTLVVLAIIPLGALILGYVVPAQDDEPHAEPARSDGPRRLPRLVPARGRRHEVPPEGGHHAGARPTAGSSPLAPVVVVHLDLPRLPRDPDRAPTSS